MYILLIIWNAWTTPSVTTEIKFATSEQCEVSKTQLEQKLRSDKIRTPAMYCILTDAKIK